MGKFIALARKEISGILLNAPMLFATAFFVLLDSFAFYMTTAGSTAAYALFDEIALFMLFTSIIVYPLISMHSFSEENANGTLETLLTAPIGNFTAVMAKYTGAMLFVIIYLLHGLVYALLLSYGGRLDWHSTATAFLALAAVGSLAMSLGIFISAITLTPAAAAAGTGGVLIFLVVAGGADPYAGNISDVLYSLSFFPHAKRWIAGEIDTRGLIYFVSATALFLFYAWMAVGSRGAEKRSADPTVRRRLTVTYILVSAGFVLCIGQIALLHIRGFWESGMPLGPGLARIPGILLTPLALAALSFGWSILTFRAARRAERGPKVRVPKYATIAEAQVMAAPRYYYEENIRARRRIALAAVAALVVVVNLNWLSHYPFRTFLGSGSLEFLAVLQDRSWDVTEDGRNSLSQTTRRTLDGLQGRVQVYSFLEENASIRSVPVAEQIRRLLERYTDYNPLVSTTYADFKREPELAAKLAEEIDIQPDKLENFLAVDYQGRRMLIPAGELVAPPDWRAQMAGDSRWVFDGENRLTQTVMRLVDPRIPNVLFTSGHLEHTLASGLRPDRSMSNLARAMSGANMRVRQYVLTGGLAIPPDCDILVVASPRISFQEHEVEEVRRYLDRGGRLLVFAPEAWDGYEASTDPLNELIFSLGGGYRDDLIEDTVNNDNSQSFAPLGRGKGGGESSVEMVFPLARSIRDNPRTVENGWTTERMVESFPTSSAVDKDGRRPGPFTMMFRSSKPAEMREARAVVFASGRMAADSDIVRGSNQALIMAMAQWLAGRAESRDIEPREWIDRRLDLTGPQLRAISWIGVVGLPLAWLIAGISVWWLRRD